MKNTTLFVSFYCLLAISIFTVVQVGAQDNSILTDFDKSFTFGYLEWEKAATLQDGIARIQAQKDNGGVGVIGPLNLTGFADRSPRLRLRLNEGNKADRLNMAFMDQDGTSFGYEFDLKNVPAGQFVEVTPVGGASLTLPGKINEAGTTAGLDLAHIKEFHVQGTWRGLPVDISFDRIDLAAPNEAIQAQRLVLQEQLKKEEENRRREAAARTERIKELLTKPNHPQDGPDVLHIGAVASDILGIEIQAQKAIRTPQVPYKPQPGDEIETKGEEVLAWVDGKPTVTQAHVTVSRKINGQKVTLGDLATGAGMLKPPDIIEGKPLTDLTVELPEAYRVTSPNDANFIQPVQPLAVYRKAKLNDLADNGMPIRHHIYLKLPHPLREGSRYAVNFSGINTRQETITYHHDPRNVRSEAVHVSHIGYRPTDPFKRAYLSVWLGTGGAHAYPNVQNLRFHLRDEATGKSVFEGKVQRAFAADQGEPSFKLKRNYSKTNVHFMDFSEFSTPGRYRVWVEGIGSSYPFEIARDVWSQAFKVSMVGLLHHRSGIELGPPFTEYKRPRTMHPQDGFKVFQLNITRLAGEADKVKDDLKTGTEGRKMEPNAWGGYMDAGDWDRRSQHLSITYDLLELFELFPAHFKNVRLALPPNEANNALPDILDEARWNLDFYKRLQLPDGGVRGGIEQTAHPRPGETSWQESLVAGVFAPDPVSSDAFAASAAKMARLLAPLDAKLAVEYRAAALKAWEWAEKNTAGLNDNNKGEWQDARNLAAVELLWLTREPHFDAAFQESTVVTQPNSEIVRQHEALFTYARLPDGIGDAVLKQKARAAILALADVGLNFAEGNSFGLTSVVPSLPPMAWVGYFSTPEMISAVLPRAHYLSGDAKYLRGAVRAANFSAGANPENMAYTIGIGPRHPQAVLHVDSKASAQPAPKGITVYGPSDPAENYEFDKWVYTWFLNRTLVPEPRSWPAAEAYVDLPNWPSMTEYTVQQNIGPTAYYWGYLAAREK
jgi:endoglucanase